MINIENILHTQVLTDPWPHQIIDNVFDAATFEQVKTVAKFINRLNDYETPEVVWMNELISLGVDSKIVDTIVSDADCVVKNYMKISANYSKRLSSNLGYFNNPRFGACPANTINEIHDEGVNKVMALIIYVDPEESHGTFLYNSNTEDSLVKEVEWKPNRGFLMFSQPGVTWHKYNSKAMPRITLNFYYEKIEALEHLEFNQEAGKMIWLHSVFGEDKLIVTNDDQY